MTTIKSKAATPASLRIMGRTFAVELVTPSDMNICGTCIAPQNVITLTEHQHPCEEADTLVHEVLHALMYLVGPRLSFNKEEEVVRALATGLMQVFHDNPEFLAYIHQAGRTKQRK